MSGKADNLLGRFGGNIASVVGNRPGAAPSPLAESGPDKFANAIRSRAFGELPLDAIARDQTQPRETFDEGDLERLAASIRRFGQLAPIRVKWNDAQGRWVILVGERRWRACRLAGLERVRVEFVDRPMTEADVAAEQMVENVGRVDLRPVEEGRGYQRLRDLNGWSVEELAATLGVQVTTVHHRLGLLRLPEDVQARVESGEIRATAGYEISKLQIADDQRAVAEMVVSEGLDYKATAAEVTRRKSWPKAKGRGAARAKLKPTRTLKAANGAKVTVEYRKGVDDAVMIAALRDVLAKLEGRADAA